MNNIYLNIRQAEENRVIVTRNSTLVDFEQEFQGEGNKKGNIYKGVVSNIEPSLEAVFVDFGESKNGLLPLREIPPNAPGVSEGGIAAGDQILVQVKKDNVGDKGAGLTGYISLAGSFLVLLPYRQESFGISSNASAEERRGLSSMMSELPVPEGMGIIVRSLAMQHSREDIQWDLESYLLRLWDAIKSAAGRMEGPVLIYRENDLLPHVMRDYFRPKSGDVIICDDRERYQELRAFVEMLFPDNVGQIRHHDGADNMVPPLIEQKIEQIYMREVSAASGVRVVFDSTEALVAIDVNSGRQREGSDIEETALKTNLEAAEIIADQLRLRNLGGLIVVDFIDMRKRENREKLEKHFAEILKKDRSRIRMNRISEFGLLELSRQRKSRSLLFSQTQACSRCSGSGWVWRDQAFALHLLRKIRTLAFNQSMQSVILQVPREISVFLLNEKRGELQQIESHSGCNIVVVPDNRLSTPQYKFKPIRGDKAQAMEVARQAAQQEGAAEYTYKPQPAVREQTPVLKGMLPQERMPSQKVSAEKPVGVWGLVKKLFGGGDAADAQGSGRTAAAAKGRGSQRRSRTRGGGSEGASRRSKAQQASGSARQQGRKNPPAKVADKPASANDGKKQAAAASSGGGGNQKRRDSSAAGRQNAAGKKPSSPPAADFRSGSEAAASAAEETASRRAPKGAAAKPAAEVPAGVRVTSAPASAQKEAAAPAAEKPAPAQPSASAAQDFITLPPITKAPTASAAEKPAAAKQGTAPPAQSAKPASAPAAAGKSEKPAAGKPLAASSAQEPVTLPPITKAPAAKPSASPAAATAPVTDWIVPAEGKSSGKAEESRDKQAAS